MSSLRVGFLIYTVLSTIVICVSSYLVKLNNIEYHNQSLDVEEGKIVGWHVDYDRKSANWQVEEDEKNLVTLQNVANSRYLSVDRQTVVTADVPYTWRRLIDFNGLSEIATIDGSHVLRLTGDSDGDEVVLIDSSRIWDDTLWLFEPLPDIGSSF